MRAARGLALVDLVFTCGLMAVLLAVAIPGLHAMRIRDGSRLAARHLAQRLHLVRLEAVKRNRAVAMRFDPDQPERIGIYLDGNGDGVRQTDITRGVDPPLGVEADLRDVFDGVSFRVASTIPAPEGAGTIAAGSDPIRLGNTNLLSFTPIGSATSGTLFLAGGDGRQLCVRVFGATGRVRVLWFDSAARTWRND